MAGSRRPATRPCWVSSTLLWWWIATSHSHTPSTTPAWRMTPRRRPLAVPLPVHSRLGPLAARATPASDTDIHLHPAHHRIGRALAGLSLAAALLFGNPHHLASVSIVPSFTRERTPAAHAADTLPTTTDSPGPRREEDFPRNFEDGNRVLQWNLPTSLPTATDSAILGDTGRQVQQAVELVRVRLEPSPQPRSSVAWNAALAQVERAKMLMSSPLLLDAVPPDRQLQAFELVNRVQDTLQQLAAAIRQPRRRPQDGMNVLALQEQCAKLVYDVRVLSMEPGVLPFSVPEEYARLPQLRGRAVVECVLSKQRNGSTFTVLIDGTTRKEQTKEVMLTMVIDGYHAPVTAGNFVDLVQRRFYDDMPIQIIDDLTIQTGKPKGGVVDGFIDPNTKGKRVIPLELFDKNDKEPLYGYTMSNQHDVRETSSSMANPFQVHGALGMVHDPDDPNTASSQFFIVLGDQAKARTTFDGRTACFGYVTTNQDILSQVEEGDTITRMRVVDGIETFVIDHATVELT